MKTNAYAAIFVRCCYRAFYLDNMKKVDKNKVIRRLDKVESAFWKAESDVSALAEIVQPLFEHEIQVCMSSDGATITDDNGEIGFVRDFLNAL